jgi:hypothetical protein
LSATAAFGRLFSEKRSGRSSARCFAQLEDRSTRYEPLLLKLFPPETRPRQREVLIELYRKGKITEAFRAFKKIYLEVIDQIIDDLKSQEVP